MGGAIELIKNKIKRMKYSELKSKRLYGTADTTITFWGSHETSFTRPATTKTTSLLDLKYIYFKVADGVFETGSYWIEGIGEIFPDDPIGQLRGKVSDTMYKEMADVVDKQIQSIFDSFDEDKIQHEVFAHGETVETDGWISSSRWTDYHGSMDGLTMDETKHRLQQSFKKAPIRQDEMGIRYQQLRSANGRFRLVPGTGHLKLREILEDDDLWQLHQKANNQLVKNISRKYTYQQIIDVVEEKGIITKYNPFGSTPDAMSDDVFNAADRKLSELWHPRMKRTYHGKADVGVKKFLTEIQAANFDSDDMPYIVHELRKWDIIASKESIESYDTYQDTVRHANTGYQNGRNWYENGRRLAASERASRMRLQALLELTQRHKD